MLPTRRSLAIAVAIGLVAGSTACNDTIAPRRKPGAPTIGAATPGNASASVQFTAPTDSGSAAITGFTATCTAGGASKTGTAPSSPVSVSALTNGTEYSCVVAAENSVGTGPASGSVTVTPFTVPNAPG